MSFDDPVDGAGLPLPQHADHLARLLDLNPQQTAILVAELRNALVPETVRPTGLGVHRILTLADALRKRG